MNEFDQTLTRHAIILMVFVCTVTTLIVCWCASRFEGRVMPTVLLSMLIIPIAIVIGAATVLVLAMEHNLSGVLSTFNKNPIAALSFFTETGAEFAIGVPISILALIIFQVRRREPSIAS